MNNKKKQKKKKKGVWGGVLMPNEAAGWRLPVGGDLLFLLSSRRLKKPIPSLGLTSILSLFLTCLLSSWKCRRCHDVI
jgi:hypothetical protein